MQDDRYHRAASDDERYVHASAAVVVSSLSPLRQRRLGPFGNPAVWPARCDSIEKEINYVIPARVQAAHCSWCWCC